MEGPDAKAGGGPSRQQRAGSVFRARRPEAIAEQSIHSPAAERLYFNKGS
jgi:hypothetical protein